MKRLLLLALCALFALNAEARTIYVDAKRPNNNGSGLSRAKAKKTIQAAINVAKKGDTILVYPGHYTRIKSNNKKIRIKSVEGESRTVILSGVDKKAAGFIVADLAAWSKNVTAHHAYWGESWTCCWKIKDHTATTLQGFKVRPTSFDSDDGTLWYFESAAAIAGGTAKNCSFEHCGKTWRYLAFDANGRLECTAAWPAFLKTKLVDCRVFDCDGMEEWYKRNGKTAATASSGIIAEGSSFRRCTITQSGSSFSSTRNGGLPESCNFRNSIFSNCLFARNWRPAFKSCTLGNCTVAGNHRTKLSGCKAYNTVFHGVAKSQFAKKNKNTLSGCYKGTSPGFVLPPIRRKWDDDGEGAFVGHQNWDWDDGAKLWAMLDDIDADYRLVKGSPCIDKGVRKKAAKKLYGSKDLNGKKRVRGKTVDIGCYEYVADPKGAVLFLNDRMVEEPNHRLWEPGDWARVFLRHRSDSETYGTLPMPKCHDAGCFAFAGWWTDPIGGKQVFASSPVSCRRLYAHWVEFDAVTLSGITVGRYYTYNPYSRNHKEFQQTIGNFSLTIPETIHGERVAGVGFDETVKEKITSITLPSSVSSLYLDWDGFSNFKSLKTIRLQNGSPLVPGEDFAVPDGCTVVRY